MDVRHQAFARGFRAELSKYGGAKAAKLLGKKALATRPLGLLAALRGKLKRKK